MSCKVSFKCVVIFIKIVVSLLLSTSDIWKKKVNRGEKQNLIENVVCCIPVSLDVRRSHCHSEVEEKDRDCVACCKTTTSNESETDLFPN